MKLAALLAVAGIFAVTVPAHAERPDCGLFPDMHSRFTCYDNVSRAPPPVPDEASKPDAAKAKAATTRNRKTPTN